MDMGQRHKTTVILKIYVIIKKKYIYVVDTRVYGLRISNNGNILSPWSPL